MCTAAFLVMLSRAGAVCDALSVARTVKVLDPAAVGVPEMVPPVSVSPAGSVPVVTDHVYGGVPRDAQPSGRGLRRAVRGAHGERARSRGSWRAGDGAASERESGGQCAG